MRTQLGNIVESLTSSLWFLPSLITLTAGALAFGLVRMENYASPQMVRDLRWVFSGGAEGARGILSAIATSTITVTGVVFSITIVALSLASSQFTPRVLRQFTSDHVNQATLGVFIGTFLYSVLVLKTVQSEDFGGFVPHIAVTGSIVLAAASIGMLIYFIHHIASTIQASTIISGMAAETQELIDHLFPQELGEEPEEVDVSNLLPQEAGSPVPMASVGYIEAVDEEGLLRTAREADLLIRMDKRVGDFVSRNASIVTVWPANRLNDAVIKRIRQCFPLGRDRTMQQDADFGVRQIVDIAVKALSPSVNDPTTAVTSIDYLGAILRHMAKRSTPSPLRIDEEGTLRIIARGSNFRRMMELAFYQIRQNSQGNVAVTIRLLETITDIAAVTSNHVRLSILRDHVNMIAAGAERAIEQPTDRADVNERIRLALAATKV